MVAARSGLGVGGGVAGAGEESALARAVGSLVSVTLISDWASKASLWSPSWLGVKVRVIHWPACVGVEREPAPDSTEAEI